MKKKKTKERPVDRRIQKTKKILSEALVSLIVEKGYEAITIKDIIEKANVGRSTFYAHFEDKEQLLLSGHDTFKRLMTEHVLPGKTSNAVDIDFLFLYRHVQEQRALTKALIGEKGGEIVRDQVYQILARRIEELFGKDGRSESEAKRFSMTVHAAASALVALLVEWMEQGMPFTPEEMAAMSESLLLNMMKH